MIKTILLRKTIEGNGRLRVRVRVNLLLEAITHVKNISKKKPTVKRLLAHINSLGENNWDEQAVEETLCILRTKGIINENYKILMTNYTNTLTSDDQLLETPLVSSTDDTPPDSNLLLFQRRNNTYKLRNFHEFATKRKRTVKMGLEILNY